MEGSSGVTDLTLRARGVRHFLGDDLEVDTPQQVHLARVDTHDIHARREGRVREFDLAVDSTRTQQRRVEDIDAICRHHHLLFDTLFVAAKDVGGHSGRKDRKGRVAFKELNFGYFPYSIHKTTIRTCVVISRHYATRQSFLSIL